MVLKFIDEDNPLILLDDSEIVKKYGRKFEDLCMVRDASSTNDETLKSIKYVKEVLGRRCTYVFDRGYDRNSYFDYFLLENKNKDDFII